MTLFIGITRQTRFGKMLAQFAFRKVGAGRRAVHMQEHIENFCCVSLMRTIVWVVNLPTGSAVALSALTERPRTMGFAGRDRLRQRRRQSRAGSIIRRRRCRPRARAKVDERRTQGVQRPEARVTRPRRRDHVASGDDGREGRGATAGAAVVGRWRKEAGQVGRGRDVAEAEAAAAHAPVAVVQWVAHQLLDQVAAHVRAAWAKVVVNELGWGAALERAVQRHRGGREADG